jgi:hypothetical protein
MRPTLRPHVLALAACLAAGVVLAGPFPLGDLPAGPVVEPRPAVELRSVEILPVSFQFAERDEGHERLVTDVHVTMDDAATHARVVAAVSDGPFLLASVPAGCYQVTATHAGRAQGVTLVVERGAPLRVAFYW